MLLLHRSAYILTNIRSNHIRINENFDQSTRCLDPTCQIDHATSKHDRFNYSNMVTSKYDNCIYINTVYAS